MKIPNLLNHDLDKTRFQNLLVASELSDCHQNPSKWRSASEQPPDDSPVPTKASYSSNS